MPLNEKRNKSTVIASITRTSTINWLPVVSGFTVRDINTLEDYCSKNSIDIAVMTVPRDAAKATAAKIKAAGIRGIWNFTNAELETDDGIFTESVHMGDSLMTLTYKLAENDAKPSEKQ